MGMTVNDIIISISKWLYTFKGYSLWRYKNGIEVMTEDYILFGKLKQKELGDESRHCVLTYGEYEAHNNCE